MALKLHSREQFCVGIGMLRQTTLLGEALLSKKYFVTCTSFAYILKVCIVCLCSQTDYTHCLQRIKTDIHNIHNDRYIICMHGVEGGVTSL